MFRQLIWPLRVFLSCAAPSLAGVFWVSQIKISKSRKEGSIRWFNDEDHLRRFGEDTKSRESFNEIYRLVVRDTLVPAMMTEDSLPGIIFFVGSIHRFSSLPARRAIYVVPGQALLGWGES